MISLTYYYHCVGPNSKPPERATEGSAGWDLAITHSSTVGPFSATLLDTGLQFFLEPGQTFSCKPRSSTFRRGLLVNNSPIDSDYRWAVADDGRLVPLTWHVVVFNATPKAQTVNTGDRLAQIVLPPGAQFINAVGHLNPSVLRGDNWVSERIGGFGSTGK